MKDTLKPGLSGSLSFSLSADDSVDPITSERHERFVIDPAGLNAKLEEKKAKVTA